MNEEKPQGSVWPCLACGAKDYEDAGDRCTGHWGCAADAQRAFEMEEFLPPDPRHHDTKPGRRLMDNPITPTAKPLAGSTGSVDSPLRAEVEHGMLVISIGVGTLVFCSRPENGGQLEGCRVDGRRRTRWAKDIADAMNKENEIGASPLTDFLDKMMQAAADDGSEALEYPKPNKRTKAGLQKLPGKPGDPEEEE